MELAANPHTQTPVSAPLTAAEWKRVLRGEPFRVLVTPKQLEFAAERAVRCMGCAHVRTQWTDPWGGVCLKARLVVSNTFPKLCPAYERSDR